jgi:hypothetical protein
MDFHSSELSSMRLKQDNINSQKRQKLKFKMLRKPRCWSPSKKLKLSLLEFYKEKKLNRQVTIFTTSISKMTTLQITEWIIPLVRAGRLMTVLNQNFSASKLALILIYLTWCVAWQKFRSWGLSSIPYGGGVFRLKKPKKWIISAEMEVVANKDSKVLIILSYMEIKMLKLQI